MFEREWSDIEIMSMVARLQAGGNPIDETKTQLIVTLRLLHKSYREIDRLRALIKGLAERHRWSPYSEEGCVCEWHKQADVERGGG